ncbi:MAG TPA: phosphoserine transaminase [Synergistaceae bacterium]|nr:phosphoserine transaminase [Synergistaceae bacterium]HQF91132.1 phosphoserine transaminase [Synergistaceae bacterium]HQH77816.1 phosphoserine transaminase [Synergistaceae bacterium]
MSRKYNFNAGPSTLPLSVLEELQQDLVDYKGMGLSLLEDSHRGPTYEAVHHEAVALFRELLGIPESHKVLFLGGGATLQFAMVPMNFLAAGKSAAYVNSGAWGKKAIEDAKKLGQVQIVFDGKESNFTTLPDPASVKVDPESAYLHFTSNETIGGLQWKEWPDAGKVPLICDMSSDIFSRAVPVKKFAYIYAGAQKNLGPAGATVAILREDMLGRIPDTLPAYLNYKNHVENDSLYNTPPVFAIWTIKLVLERMKKLGGLAAAADHNARKAAVLYEAIAKSGGFYSCPVDPKYRSDMNVVFRLPSEDLEKKFVKEAEVLGMIGLKGHRSVGGCRASLYNAMPLEGSQALAAFMKDFAAKNG